MFEVHMIKKLQYGGFGTPAIIKSFNTQDEANAFVVGNADDYMMGYVIVEVCPHGLECCDSCYPMGE